MTNAETRLQSSGSENRGAERRSGAAGTCIRSHASRPGDDLGLAGLGADESMSATSGA
jgi:hypothetical protein